MCANYDALILKFSMKSLFLQKISKPIKILSIIYKKFNRVSSQ